jgi:hypothetical protein
MAEIRINATGGVKLYDADDSHYAQIIAGTITSNVDVMTLGHAAVVMGTKLDLNGNNLILDADADTYLDGGTADDIVDVYVAGAKDWKWGANSINILSGTTLTIDSGATITNSGTASGFGGADPSSADGDTLGTASLEWSDLYLADSGVIYFGNDQDITLTHAPDTGLILGGTTPTLTIGDAGAEDTKIVFDGNAQDWHIGLDDSADDLVIGLGSTLGTTTHMSFDETGAVLKPLQPAFLATPASAQNNIAIDTDVTAIFGTEIFDQNADFASNTFTAPVAGRYYFSSGIRFGAFDADMGYFIHRIKTSNRNLEMYYGPTLNSDGVMSFTTSALADMDASDTASIEVHQSGGTSQIDLKDASWFSGHLVC